MASQALGLLETKGLACLVYGTDAMLKAADVELTGPVTNVGSALNSVTIKGDVAAVKAAIDAGAEAANRIGEVVSAHVIPRPASDVEAVLPKAKPATKRASK